ncbi:MAG TPA: CBS domain-containing protein [Rhodocyclaceae bacterium]
MGATDAGLDFENGSGLNPGEIRMSDADIVGAMASIRGYLDISTADFRLLYHAAHRNALLRLVGQIRARTLMRSGLPVLTAGMAMDEAARIIAASGFKGLPVVDAGNRLSGMLTETDFLKRLEAGSFLALLLQLIGDDGELAHRCHETRVAEAMTSPVVAVPPSADFRDILEAFRQHPGRTMPVVGERGEVLGLLLRKDCLSALTPDIPL